MRDKLLEAFEELDGAKKLSNNFFSFIINPEKEKCVMITAGIHGNEPTPVVALFELLKEGIKTDYKVIILPCLNPYGFVNNKVGNCNGVNLNRDSYSKNPQKETRTVLELVKKHKPIFVLNMHEDPDEEMFYVYNENSLELARKIVETVDIDVYEEKKIHNDTVINGIITGGEVNGSFEDWLTEQKIPNICTETPGLKEFEDRVEVNKQIIKLVISYNN